MAMPIGDDPSRAADVRAVATLWGGKTTASLDDPELLRQSLAVTQSGKDYVSYLVARDKVGHIIGAVSMIARGMFIASIDSLGVSPAHQCQGIGRTLLVTAIDSCFRTPTKAIVANGQASARPLLESLGFETDEVDSSTNATMYLYR